MFDRLMLMELRDNVAKLDSKAYAELKAYNNPPQIVLHILRATLAIFYQDMAAEGEFDDWSKVKGVIVNVVIIIIIIIIKIMIALKGAIQDILCICLLVLRYEYNGSLCVIFTVHQ